MCDVIRRSLLVVPPVSFRNALSDSPSTSPLSISPLSQVSPYILSPAGCVTRRNKPSMRKSMSMDPPRSPDVTTFDWFSAPKDDSVMIGLCGLLLPIPVRGNDNHPDTRTALAISAAANEQDSDDEDSNVDINSIATNGIVKPPTKNRAERRVRADIKFGRTRSRTICVGFTKDLSIYEYDKQDVSISPYESSPQNKKQT
eukprot:GHVL01026650.1.p1 GENE.GHVL01026650.1~~GHVL01026650.1.p1  ORF type:complete len:212 (-),score=34.90 GHVL01026650.1:71-670(-)